MLSLKTHAPSTEKRKGFLSFSPPKMQSALSSIPHQPTPATPATRYRQLHSSHPPLSIPLQPTPATRRFHSSNYRRWRHNKPSPLNPSSGTRSSAVQCFIPVVLLLCFIWFVSFTLVSPICIFLLKSELFDCCFESSDEIHNKFELFDRYYVISLNWLN